VKGEKGAGETELPVVERCLACEADEFAPVYVYLWCFSSFLLRFLRLFAAILASLLTFASLREIFSSLVVPGEQFIYRSTLFAICYLLFAIRSFPVPL
jgi:hypothetical protein